MAISESTDQSSQIKNRVGLSNADSNSSGTTNTSGNKIGGTMEYTWLEPHHDPITTDTNLAEIDFEDFRNEDLVYAFSCGEDESGGSSADMSICRSEVLFSSMRDSSLNQPGEALPPMGGVKLANIQDSLMDAPDFNYADQVKVNKNHYQLTYSGHGGATSSLYASMSSSGAIGSTSGDENNPIPLLLGSGSGSGESPGKLTTWSNLGSKQRSESYNQSHQQPPERWRSRHREENSLNNNNNVAASSSSSPSTSSTESRKSRSLPDMGREKRGGNTNQNTNDVTPGTQAKLVSAFMRNREDRVSFDDPNGGPSLMTLLGDNQEQEEQQFGGCGIPMMRSKDTVNQFLKTASRQLTSIEEAAAEHGGLSGASSSQASHSEGSAQVAGNPVNTDTVKRRPPTSKATTPSSNRSSRAYPDLDFLENDVSLWDAFFLHSKNSSKFQSVLKPPPLPLETYLQQRTPNPKSRRIRNSESLRTLLPEPQKHLLGSMEEARSSPISQVCNSLSRLHTADHRVMRSQDIQNEAIKSMFNQRQGTSTTNDPVQVVKVKEAWTEAPEKEQVVLRRRSRGQLRDDANLNLINNNNQSGSVEGASKRRSYHPQDYLSQVLQPPTTPISASMSGRIPRRPSEFPKSGSQNDLCDTWTPEEEDRSNSRLSRLSAATLSGLQGAQRNNGASAEYPFHMNLYMPPHGINLDLTQKRGLFITLYQAVERLLMYQEDPGTSGMSPSTSARCILFHELCPALYAIMSDGLKNEVITSFGRMKTTVWSVIEALTRQGQAAAQSTCDLVMLLNTKFAATGEDERKFAGFVAGLLNMSTLHIWYSKLKWNMDVLLRFYERHAYICALHKETRLLFDELNFCLQRLYSIPFHIDLPFSSDLLETVPSTTFYSRSSSSWGTSGTGGSFKTPTPTSESGSTLSGSGRKAKSRIPRPISLPKRLEAKLGTSPSPVRSTKLKSQKSLESPSGPKPPSGRKSRVRETIRLFDSSNTKQKPPVIVRNPSATGARSRRSLQVKSPKTGAGEAMARLDGSGGGRTPDT
eukprot:maker-scaffold435_size171904-snap-gene-0.29 protein:Tk07243 transcript:maker-scaffold435_size171904-snap-gene-0.29-mRNA-1 annotation:"hypothetical protein KGM_08503"